MKEDKGSEESVKDFEHDDMMAVVKVLSMHARRAYVRKRRWGGNLGGLDHRH